MTGGELRARTAIVALFAAAVLVGDGAAAETIRIEIEGLVFRPEQVTAHVGDSIEWVNDDFVEHSATARDGEWDVKLPPHATGSITVKSPGAVAYYCRYHPNMKGEITVVAP
jgi:plastocyanin